MEFIHDGRVITIPSTRGTHLTSKTILEISHGSGDLLLIEFTFDEVQAVELGDFVKDLVPMSFDQHSSQIILDMIRSMSYMPYVTPQNSRVHILRYHVAILQNPGVRLITRQLAEYSWSSFCIFSYKYTNSYTILQEFDV